MPKPTSDRPSARAADSPSAAKAASSKPGLKVSAAKAKSDGAKPSNRGKSPSQRSKANHRPKAAKGNTSTDAQNGLAAIDESAEAAPTSGVAGDAAAAGAAPAVTEELVDISDQPGAVANDADGAAATSSKGAAKAPAKRKRQGISAESTKTASSSTPHQKVTVPKSEETREMLMRATAKCALLSGLSDGQRAEIVDAMSPVTFKADEVVIKQGDPGDNFYCVGSGEYNVFLQQQVLSEGCHMPPAPRPSPWHVHVHAHAWRHACSVHARVPRGSPRTCRCTNMGVATPLASWHCCTTALGQRPW